MSREAQIKSMWEVLSRGDRNALIELLTSTGLSVNEPIDAREYGVRYPWCKNKDHGYATWLHLLAERPDVPNSGMMVEVICDAKAALNARSSLGATPLTVAAYWKHVPAVEILLE